MKSLLLCITFLFNTVQGNIWTVDLATLTTQRLDPIVFPGQSPAGHVHSIVGGSKFGKSATYEDMLTSRCTTGNVDKDLSAYWVPSMYVEKTNGKFYHVPLNFHVYYKLINDRSQTDFKYNPIIPGEFHAFPAGFKMKAGSPAMTEAYHPINHKCYIADKPASEYPTTDGFPTNPSYCTGGIRSEVTFPSCWDGHTLDSVDQSHVTYPGPNGRWEVGACPSSHPVRLPTIFFEAMFLIQKVGVEVGDKLVYSFGDYSGYGFHGDFLNGWEDGVIDSLVDYCINNKDGMAKQCNIWDIAGKDGGLNYSCKWEGEEDSSPYLGELDKLPPRE